jgi:serine-type D-Ala-D-Ala carboxypeptidase (penicillin-binding protein 5/6)
VAEPKVWKGERDSLALGVAQPLKVTIPRGRYADLKATMQLPAELIAPFAAGAEVGKVSLTLDDEPVAEVPLIAQAELPEGGFFKRSSDGFWMWWESD